MIGGPLDHRPQAHDRVAAALLGDPPGGERNLERPRHPYHGDVGVGDAVAAQAVARTSSATADSRPYWVRCSASAGPTRRV